MDGDCLPRRQCNYACAGISFRHVQISAQVQRNVSGLAGLHGLGVPCKWRRVPFQPSPQIAHVDAYSSLDGERLHDGRGGINQDDIHSIFLQSTASFLPPQIDFLCCLWDYSSPWQPCLTLCCGLFLYSIRQWFTQINKNDIRIFQISIFQISFSHQTQWCHSFLPPFFFCSTPYPTGVFKLFCSPNQQQSALIATVNFIVLLFLNGYGDTILGLFASGHPSCCTCEVW